MAMLNAQISSMKIPEALSSLLLLANANVDDVQRITVFAAATAASISSTDASTVDYLREKR